jgi:uncharacterized protein YfaS (alpha-2-macroglobulin family)
MISSKDAALELQAQADAMASDYGDEEPTAKTFRHIAYLILLIASQRNELKAALQGILDDDDAGTSLADQRARWGDRMAAAKAAIANAQGAA